MGGAVSAGKQPESRRDAANGPEAAGWSTTASLIRAEQLVVSPRLFEQFVYGLVLADGEGRVLYLNRKARQLLLPSSAPGDRWSCCDLVCSRLGPLLGAGCMSKLALTAAREMSEVRMDIEQEHQQTAAWVTISKLEEDRSRVLFLLRPGRAGDRRRRTGPDWRGQVCPSQRAELEISCLGGLEVEGADRPLNGEWLDHRSGQLLKYLLCERRRAISSDQICEALWPEAGAAESKSRLRYTVHGLRERLEPGRAHRSTPRFVIARRGGYLLETTGVWVDADRFEREAAAGLASLGQGLRSAAAVHLTGAMQLYRGDFLAEDPYIEWAVAERERLRELAGRVLRAQTEIAIEQGQLEAASDHARRLVEMEPFDGDAQSLLIETCLRRGRRSEAVRRFAHFRKKMLDSFAQEPDFDLIELERSLATRLT